MKLRVFLVEDYKRLHSLLAELFARLGSFEIVGTAATEAEALLWLDEHAQEWDLAVIDLILDQGSGLGAIARCHRTRGPATAIIVFSSYATPGMRKHCLKLGADAVFEKSDSAAFIDYCMQWSDKRLGQPPAPDL
ncbi:MAG: response regulator [Pseudomonadota bacterium]